MTAFSIEQFQKERTGGAYVSDERLYRTADGRLCAEDDPEAAFMVVGKGGHLPVDEAMKYGLIREPEPEKYEDGLDKLLSKEIDEVAEDEGISLVNARNKGQKIAAIREGRKSRKGLEDKRRKNTKDK